MLAGVGSEAGQLGVPVERVLGLAEAALTAISSADWIRERVAVDERVVAVLDAERCLERAEARFSDSVASNRSVSEPHAGAESTTQEFSTGEGPL